MDSLQFLKDILSIYSPSFEESEIVGFLSERLAQYGFSTSIDEVGNIIARLGDGEPRIILLGHIDTVKGFLPVIEKDGKIYGRGAVDAKGPFAAFVCAALLAKDQLKLPLAVIGAVEEEVTSSAGARHVAPKYDPRYCIIGEPSSWEGITLGYKGHVTIEYIIKEEKLHYSGRRTTAAEKGINFWNDVKNYCDSYNREKKLFDALLPTLIQINSSDDDYNLEFEGKIGIRLPPDFKLNNLIEWLDERKTSAKVYFTGHEKAIRVDKNNPLVRTFIKAIRSMNGTPTFKYKTGTSDMNVVGVHWNCPLAAYGPGDSTLDHSPNEHIYIRNFLNGIEVLHKVLVSLR